MLWLNENVLLNIIILLKEEMFLVFIRRDGILL